MAAVAHDGAESLAGVHRNVRARLREAGIDEADLDARSLVLATTGLALTDLVARPDQPVAAADIARLDERVARRIAGEPVHRILGRRSFYGLELELSTDTLEPRPDTEILVDALRPHVERVIEGQGHCRILDLGTGTGAICLALLSLYPQAQGTGTDIARGALLTAVANARRLGVAERFVAVESDWYSAVDGRFDIIASNPPYIRSGEIESLSVEVRAHDPLRALDGGPDGLAAYRAIAAGASSHLTPGGIVGVEIGYDQHSAVADLFEAQGLALLEARTDLGSRDRILVFAAPQGNADDKHSGEFPGR